MCLQNSKREKEYFAKLDKLDTYKYDQSTSHQFVDVCDYVDLVNCKELPIGMRHLCIMQLNIEVC